MAWSMKTEGLEELSAMLSRLGDRAQDVATGALFDGAAVVADAYTKAIDNIQSKPDRFYAVDGKFQRLPTDEEKNALRGKIGIAKFKKNGSEVDTIIGVTKNAGYVQIGGKKKAVAVIARSINSGTSFMKKQPVFRKAGNAVKAAAKEAIVGKAEEMFEKIINGD